MPHFFIKSSDIKNSQIYIEKGENYTHLKSALRVRIGENVLFIDENYTQYETLIDNINNSQIIANITNQYPSKRFTKLHFSLAQSMLKTDAQNYVVQKATELGIKTIIPLLTDNCVIKKSVAEQKIPHLQKIAYEACKQCERPDIPEILFPKNFDFVLNNDFDYVVVLAERHAEYTLPELFNQIDITEDKRILLVTGPEGGFSQREFELMDEYKLKKATLGNLILRADTAVIAGVASTMILASH